MFFQVVDDRGGHNRAAADFHAPDATEFGRRNEVNQEHRRVQRRRHRRLFGPRSVP